MTVYACPFEHPDGYLVWGDPVETCRALEAVGLDPHVAMVTRLLPWLAYGTSAIAVRYLYEGHGAVLTDKYGPSLAYYTAIGDRERVAVLEKLAREG